MSRLLFSHTASLTSTIFLSLLMAFLPGNTVATEFFRAQGDHSLNSIFGIPTPIPPALNLEQSQLIISGTYANQFSGGKTESESLRIDGERAELRLSWHRKFRSCFNWGIDIPLIAHGGGYFDQFIEGWHHLLGLPNGDRDQTEENLLSIEYQDTNGQQLNMHSSSASIGDTHIQLIKQGACGNHENILSTVSARVGVKLPTGEERLLSGSGAPDLYVDFTTGDIAPSSALGFRISAGVIALGDTEIVSNQEEWAVYGSSVVGWHYSPKLELVTQLDWHSRLFNSELRELGSFTIQWTVGGRWRLQSDALLDIAIQEDVAPDTAPDITIHLGYRRAF